MEKTYLEEVAGFIVRKLELYTNSKKRAHERAINRGVQRDIEGFVVLCRYVIRDPGKSRNT